MANRPIYPDTIKNATLEIEPADTTTTQSLLAAGANGARVNSISVSSDDTSAVVLAVYYYDGTTDFLIGSINIPTLSGTDGVVPVVSLLNATDFPFLGDDLAFYLEATDEIRIAALTTVTTAKKITLVANYGDY